MIPLSWYYEKIVVRSLINVLKAATCGLYMLSRGHNQYP